MSWLSKTVKKVTSNPLATIAAPLTIGTTKLFDQATGLFKDKPGPENPYGKPDLAYLGNTDKLNYLMDASPYNNLKDKSQYNFLLDPSKRNTAAEALPGNLKTFGDTYKAPDRSASSAAFQDYISKIGGPSSVDDVQRGVDSDIMNQLLEGIDTDTKNQVGSSKMDFFDRGLGGPGQISDIEANALAQVYSGAGKNKAAARSDFASKELARLKAKEDQTNAAYGKAYDTSVGFDTQDANANLQGALTDTNNYNDALKTGVAANESALGRDEQNKLAYGSAIQSGNQAFADKQSSAQQLFAQLLNSRDLGAAGINSANYNTGVENQYKYAKPSLFDTLLNGAASAAGPAIIGALI